MELICAEMLLRKGSRLSFEVIQENDKIESEMK